MQRASCGTSTIRVVCLLAAITLLGCDLPNPQTATVAAQPDTPIVKNITSFTNSLRCMDDLFLSYGKRDIVITSDGLPDQTNQITTGTKEMMISAISRMSTKSHAFRFVDVDRRQDAVFWIQQNWIGVRDGLLAPNYYIRGAITQVDAGVMNDSQAAGFSIPEFSIGLSRDQIVSVVSMDMNIGNIINRQIIPGLSSTNSIAVSKSGKGLDTEGLIEKAGLFFEVSRDRSQGSHQAVRTLVELGLIEVLGKLTQVPYWRCLEIDSTNPEMIAQARDWYDGLSEDERLRVTQRALAKKGIYTGPVDGAMSARLRDGINRYKAENDLIADGRVDFDLYYSFLVNDLAIRAAADKGDPASPPHPPSDTPSFGGSTSFSLSIDPEGGTDRVYRVGEKVRFAFHASEDADVYCYYQDVGGAVVRIFPSRFQDDSHVRGGAHVMVPSQNARFSIKPETPGEENIACVATTLAYSSANRPFVLDEPDLTPLSVKSLSAAVDQHLDVDRFKTTVQHMRIRVR